MGKKTRIVLLSITAAIAVFTFFAMWIVRPDSQSSVLDSARERQNEPLLQVAEPLETDVAVLSAEEEMAEKVSQILASDEEFISALAEDIAGRISLDDYIPEIVETVYNRISEDYDAVAAEIASMVDESFEDDVLALYEKYKQNVVSDIVLAILEEYDSLSEAEKSDVLGLEEQLKALYEKYRDAIIEDLGLDSLSGGLSEDDVDSIILSFYESRKDEIVSDVSKSIESVPAETAAEPEPVAAEEPEPVAVPETPAEPAEVDEPIIKGYAFAGYTLTATIDTGSTLLEYPAVATNDDVNAFFALENEKYDLASMGVAYAFRGAGGEVVITYPDTYSKEAVADELDTLVADLIAYLTTPVAEPEPEAAVVEEPEPVAVPETPAEPVESDEPIVKEYAFAGYTLTATVDTGSTLLEYPAVATNDDVNAFFALENEKYDLASMGVAYAFLGAGEVVITYPDTYSKEAVADELDTLVADLIAYLTTPVAEPEPEVAVVEEPEPATEPEPIAAEEAKPAKTRVSAPSFGQGGIIDPDASAEEYEAARTELRKAEIDKALQFIAD